MNENVNQLVKLQNENIPGVTLNVEVKGEVLEKPEAPAKTSLQETMEKHLYEKGMMLSNFLNGNMNRYKSIITAFARELILNELTNCTTKSLITALEKCCRYNLAPGGGSGKMFLVSYKGHVQAMFGYKGYLELIMRNPDVEFCDGKIVYEGDEFSVQHSNQSTFIHIPAIENRGKLRCTYAYIQYKSGRIIIEVANLDDIEKARSFAKTKHIWSSHYEAMAQVAAFRMLSNIALSIPLEDQDYYIPPEDQNHD